MEIKIKINIDGIKTLDVKKGASPREIFSKFDFQGNNQPLAARYNNSLIDLSSPLQKDGSLEPVSFEDEEGKLIYWHSTAHIMAQAVKRLYPNTILAIGPAISEGFYYDFYTENPFSPEDMTKIEKEMKKIIKQDIPFEKVEMSKDEAITLFSHKKEKFKLELLSELNGEVTIYKNDEFVDLCRGPHVPSTGYIGAFKLLSVSGSYWRGDQKRENLQRIYGISFQTKDKLKDYLQKLKEAKQRDHRKLGKELNLFSIYEEAGPGLIFYHPNGATLRRIIEDYWKDEHLKNGYQLVMTPHIAKSELWRASGHYDYYIENMYTFNKDEEEFVIKPMNCPGHILLYKSEIRSYRDLPIRYAELGTVVRDELSGVLQGMLRVREFTIDDAHIFCTEEQIDDEILGVLRFAREITKTFGFHKLGFELSVREEEYGDKYAGCDEDWEKAERSLINALETEKLEYKRMEGEAVFYGPKIDIQLYDALGRKWQGPTIQFDFNLPSRLDITYVGKDGNPHNVYIVHRTVLGSIERFIGALIEHYKGNFPLWLAPIQVIVMTITNKCNDYAKEINEKLKAHNIRTKLDIRNEKIGFKIREAEKQKIPYMAIIGEKEKEANNVSIRERHRKKRGSLGIKSLISEIEEKCNNKT
jgi:threonyl-tRNA synthetase